MVSRNGSLWVSFDCTIANIISRLSPITGCWADYFSTAVRTEKGISMLLIERGEGVETKPINVSYLIRSGTAYVTFDNVKVPVE